MKARLLCKLVALTFLCSLLHINTVMAASKKYDYVVITTKYIKDNSQSLSEFLNEKIKMGFNPLVVTETTSHSKGGWGGGTGNDASENIRKWLKKYYSNLGIKYVLLIGDPNSKNGDVPMKVVHAIRNIDDEGIINQRVVDSDMYYAELNENWDSNGDGYFGVSPDEIYNDLDVIVGRIPVYSNNMTNLDKILSRLTNYTKIGDVPYKKNVLIAAEPMNDKYKNSGIGEAIKKDILNPSGFKSYRIYDDTKPSPDKSPCNVDNVVSSWKSFDPAIVIWSTHGSSTSASDVMSSSRTKDLSDNTPEFVFSSSCHNGSPSKSNNLAYSLLLNSSVGVLSSTAMTAWSSEENYDGYLRSSNGVAYNFLKLFVNNMSIGEAYSSVVKNAKDLKGWRNLVEYNIYGDPSLKLRLPHYMISDSKIFDKWNQMGSNTGNLGNAITSTAKTPNKLGVYNHFDGGSIYRKNSSGEAFAIYGLNRAKWADMGWENSILGFPTTDELSTYNNGGRFNHFDGGSIYYKNGAKESFEVHGDIRALWSWLGWETSQLGYPISDEYTPKGKNTSSTYRASKFENGVMYYENFKGAPYVNPYINTWPVMGVVKQGASPYGRQKITSVSSSYGYSGDFLATSFSVKGSGFPANKKVTAYLSSVDDCYEINTVKTNNNGEFTLSGNCYTAGIPTYKGVATIWVRSEAGPAAIYSYKPVNIKTTNTNTLR